MKEILLRELFRNTDQYQDKEVTVRGWIRNNRSSNKFGFIELNDGSFFKSVQVYKSTAFIPIRQKLKRKTSFARLYLFVPGCIIKE